MKLNEFVAIIGAGGLGREAIDIAASIPKLSPVGFIDENPRMQGQVLNGYPVLGGIEWFANHPEVKAVCAIGNNYSRKNVTDRAQELGIDFINVIDPNVHIGSSFKIGTGCVIVQGVNITPNVSLGDHVYINLDTVVAHDDVLEDYVNICPGVHLSGNVTLREGAHIYTGAVIIPGVTVGKWAEVAAGAVVLKDVPDYTLVAGMPAVVKKDVRSRPGWIKP